MDLISASLDLPGFAQPWENAQGVTLVERKQTAIYGKPERIASALQIMLDAPLGAAAFKVELFTTSAALAAMGCRRHTVNSEESACQCNLYAYLSI